LELQLKSGASSRMESVRALLTRIQLEAKSDNLQSKTIFWLLLFLGLNVVDTMLTNRAHAMLESVGISGKTAEANLILQPLVGSWLLVLKGAFALVIMVGINRVARIPLRRMLVWACLALAIVCLWNAKSIGIL
jgi:hypothetical protein